MMSAKPHPQARRKPAAAASPVVIAPAIAPAPAAVSARPTRRGGGLCGGRRAPLAPARRRPRHRAGALGRGGGGHSPRARAAGVPCDLCGDGEGAPPVAAGRRPHRGPGRVHRGGVFRPHRVPPGPRPVRQDPRRPELPPSDAHARPRPALDAAAPAGRFLRHLLRPGPPEVRVALLPRGGADVRPDDLARPADVGDAGRGSRGGRRAALPGRHGTDRRGGRGIWPP